MSGRILVDITHPAHFHFFRRAMEIWRQNGIELIVAARDKDLTLDLLESHGYDYALLSRARRGLAGLALELIEHQARLLRFIRRTRPQVLVEVAGTFIVHAARVARLPALVFYDTEHARASNLITYPFATRILTPACYQSDLGAKQIRYEGYHELAYLDPRHFRPDPAALQEAGLAPGESYFVLRFVSWDASHDVGQRGFSYDDKRDLVRRLSRYGKVLITSEAALEPQLEPFRLRAAPENIHHLLAFARLYIGEGSTMASEAAVLGTPAIYVNTLPLGYIYEQQHRYGLVHWLPQSREAIRLAEAFAADDHIKEEWRCRRDRMLSDKIDVTAFIREQVEAYI